jgi:hypothetical protein
MEVATATSPYPFAPDTIDELASYISNRGQCKLTRIVLSYGVPPAPTSTELQNAEASILSPTAIETGVLNAIAKGLSVPKITLPIVDTGEKRRLLTRLDFENIKRSFVAAKLHFVLNQFYLPIVAAVNQDDRGLVLPGIWPHILAKGKKKKYDETYYRGFKFDLNVHASYLFAILRERPCIVSLHRS